jgi:hypothetical protein
VLQSASAAARFWTRWPYAKVEPVNRISRRSLRRATLYSASVIEWAGMLNADLGLLRVTMGVPHTPAPQLREPSGVPVITERTAGRMLRPAFPLPMSLFESWLAVAEQKKPLKSNCPILGFRSSMGALALASRKRSLSISFWSNLNCACEPFPALADKAG